MVVKGTILEDLTFVRIETEFKKLCQDKSVCLSKLGTWLSYIPRPLTIKLGYRTEFWPIEYGWEGCISPQEMVPKNIQSIIFLSCIKNNNTHLLC